ncbi:MAG TPA: metallophosphoesterase family protein [Xenococcaceae cyanobacterium]|jgi:Icc-related predicted phosphoesterase
MGFCQSRLRILLNILIGISLVVVLHACQPQQTAPPVTISPSTSTAKTTALPPETQALISSLGTEGLYNPPRGDVRLVAISDLNGVYGSTEYDPEVDKAMHLLPFWQPDMVVCSGDMVAGQDPTLSPEELEAMWLAFDNHIAAPLRQANLPYGFTIGNHDASSAKSVTGGFLFERERNVAAEYWNNPAHNPGIEFIDRFEFPFFYTFKFNDIFFLAWDGSSSQIPQDKLSWVEQALESPEAQSARIKILLGHLPLYAITVGRDQPGEVMEDADRLREMLERHQVHTYISGHHHAYYPAHKGKLQLLHMGILGSGPRPFVASQLPPQKALTVIDINFADPDLTIYTTYDMQTLKLIELEQLPRSITGHNGIVLRRDLEMEDLTKSSQALSF